MADAEAKDQGAAEQSREAEAAPTSLDAAIETPPEGSVADAYHRRARLAEDRLAEVLAAYRKLKLENEAHRQRVTKNIERRFEQRLEKLLLSFVDILDNFDRALEATEQTYAGNPLIDGLILVRTQLLQALREQGLERIPAIGLPFDPAHSEAVEARVVDDPDQHHVVLRELMRGYRIQGRLVRPSRVIVGDYAGAGEASSTQAAPSAPAAEGETPAEPAAAGSGPTPSEGEAEHALTELAEPELPLPQESPAEPSLEEIIDRAEAHEAVFPEPLDEAEPEAPADTTKRKADEGEE
jgi:molecular chaperone GrpE